MRHGLPLAAGRASWVTRSGRMLVEGVDDGLVAAMSTPRDRRGRIERSGLKQHPSGAAVRAHWDDVLRRSEPLCTPIEPPSRSDALDEYRFASELGDDVVSRAHVVRAWAGACPAGEPPARVLAAATLAAPQLDGQARCPAVVVRDPSGVTVLGPRPRDLRALAAWQERRRALAAHLEKGHRVAHVLDARGATARERLSLASLDATIGVVRRGAMVGSVRPRSTTRRLAVTVTSPPRGTWDLSTRV
jgi:hypothetical protein